MSTAELETTKAIIISLQKQKINRFVIAEFVLEFWLNQLSVLADEYLKFCKIYAESVTAFNNCQVMIQNDLLAIQAARNAGGVNMDRLLSNLSSSLKEESWAKEFVDKLYHVDLPPITLKIKKVRWFIIYKLLNGLADRNRGWKKLEMVMKGHNKDIILRVKRADRF
jgi:hypothetical protein